MEYLNQIRYFFKLLLVTAFSCFNTFLIAQDCTVNAGVSTTVCEYPASTLFLNGVTNDPNGPILGVNWTLVSGPNVPTILDTDSLDSEVIDFITGTYTFRLTAQCSEGDFAFDDVEILVVDSPVMPFIQDSFEVCRDQIIKFDGETGVTYNWRKVGIERSWIFRPGNGDSTSIIEFNTFGATGGGYLDAYLEANNGVCIVNDTFNVLFVGADTIVNAGADVAVCGNSFRKFADPIYWDADSYSDPGFGSTIEWNQLSGPNTATITVASDNEDVNFTNLVPGTYEFEYVVNVMDPCTESGRDTVIFVVSSENLSGSFSGTSYEIVCPGETDFFIETDLTPKKGETITWNSADCPHLVIPNLNSTSNLVSGFVPCDNCNINVTLDNGICSTTRTYHVDAIDAYVNDAYYDDGCGDNSIGVGYGISGCNIGTPDARRTVWTVVSSPDFPTGENSHIVSNLSPGTHIWKGELYTKDGCFIDDFYKTAVVSMPAPDANAGTDPVIPCGNTSAILSANSTGIYDLGTWFQLSGPNTATISDIHNHEPTLTGLIPGEYVFQWYVNGGLECSTTADEVTVLIPLPSLPAADAGADFTTCYGGVIDLDGSIPLDGSIGTWTVSPAGPIFTEVNDPFTSVTGTAPNTTYTFTWTIANDCTSTSDDVIVTSDSNEGGIIADAGPDQCVSNNLSTFNLAANTASPASATGTWNIISQPGSATITDVNDPNTTIVNASADGTYVLEWIISVAGCTESRDTVLISNVGTPNALDNETFCGTTGNLSASYTTGIVWTQVLGTPGGAIIEDSFNRISPVTFLQPGQYTFELSAGTAACAEKDYMVLTASFPDTPVAGGDRVICNDNSATLSANTVTGGNWQVIERPEYSNSPTFSDVMDPNATVTGLDYGTYKFAWDSPSVEPNLSCLLSDTIEVSLIPRADAGGNATVCQVDEFLLSGNDPSDAAIGSWSVVSGPTTPLLTSLNEKEAVASNLIAGTYTFQYDVVASGCNTSDLMTLTIDSLHHADGGDDMNVCDPTISLNGVAPPAGVTAEWSKVGGPNSGSFGAPVSEPINSYSPLDENSVYHFIYETTNGSCVSQEDIFVITCQVYLPVELTAFDINSNGCEVAVNWEAASEEAFGYYEIERATSNELTFEPIHTIEPNGDKKYTWIDKKVTPGRNFYRLKMWNNDGSFEYSQIKMAMVDCGEITDDQFIVFPNPVVLDINNSISAKLDLKGNYQMYVVNIFGHKLLEMPLTNLDGWTTINIPFNDFPSGTYFLSIETESGRVKSKRVIVQE